MVWLIDEAGMAPTRVSAELLAAADRDGVKVVALGDSGQLASVEAGGWLGRCRSSWVLTSFVAWSVNAIPRSGLCSRSCTAVTRIGGWSSSEGGGELVVHDGGPQAAQEAAMAASWRADVGEVGIEQAIMIVRDNQTRARLNDEAGRWRDARGELGERIEIGGLDVAVGDRVIARRNDRALDVDNGTAAPSAPSTSTRRRSPSRPTPESSANCRRTTSPRTSNTPTRSPGTPVRAQRWSAR